LTTPHPLYSNNSTGELLQNNTAIIPVQSILILC
jgi:hypothetical protein